MLRLFRVLRVAPGAFVAGIYLAGCGGGSSTTANPSSFDATRAQTRLTDFATQNSKVGTSAVVVHGNALLWSGTTGQANKEAGKAVTTDTPFLIASISKTVTGVAAMQLVEEGRLNLDANINQYLPFQIANPNQPEGIITMRRLLTHTSGIEDAHYNTFAGAIADGEFYYKNGDPTLSLADFCRGFFAVGGTYYNGATFSAQPVGTRYSYSNIGIALAGYVVERASGEPFDSLCKRRIFQPLGMTRTSWRVADFRAEDLAMPYTEEGTPIGHFTFADYPDGAIRTTATDLSRFLRAITNDGTFNNVRILKPETVREMLRVQFPNVPDAEGSTELSTQQRLAWTGLNINGRGLIGHAGGEAGTSAYMFYDTATQIGVILLQNTADTEAAPVVELFENLIALGESNAR